MSAATPLLARFQRLEAFLLAHAHLWQPAPFHGNPPWTTAHPELYNALVALSGDEMESLEHNADALVQWLSSYLPELDPLADLTRLPLTPGTLPKRWPLGFEWDIPGRKWAQIEAFTALLQPRTQTVIDWCAGKGHLSRSLAYQHEHVVVALEWNAALCQAASQLNLKHHITVTCHQQDVLADDAAQHIHSDCHCVALHACGKLHLRLMQLAVQQAAQALTFSPCCYHLIDTEVYTPLTALDPTRFSQRLVPSREQLRLAMQETVTANGHARRLRDRKSAWRLGFRQFATMHLAGDGLALPTLADRYFHGSFAEFCTAIAAERGDSMTAAIGLPSTIDFSALEKAGWQAHAHVQRLELVRHAFRRALEVWLCLDRACWLEAQGYAVSVREFCASALTPRNIVIEAVKAHLIRVNPNQKHT